MHDLGLRHHVFPYLFASSLSRTRADDRELPAITLERELLWVAGVLRVNAARLNEYLVRKQRIENLISMGVYPDALAELTVLGEGGGYSLWLIEVRQMILQMYGGLNAQKEFLRQIRKERKAGDPLAYIAFHGSIRNENTTQIFSFREHFADHIRATVDDPAIQKWLLFRICDNVGGPADAAEVLRSEQASPLIDWYETFMRLARHAFAFETEESAVFAEALVLLQGAVKDLRIARMLSLLPDYEHLLDEMQLEDLRNRDSRLTGRVPTSEIPKPTALQTAYYQVDGLSSSNDVLELQSQSQNSVPQTVLEELRNMTAPVPNIQSFFTLMRLALNLRFTSFPGSFYLPAWRQLSSSMLPERHLLRGEYIDASELGLSHLELFSDEMKSRLLDRFVEANPSSASVYLASLSLRLQHPSIADERESIEASVSHDRQELAAIIALVRDEAWSAAVRRATRLMCSEDLSIRREAARIVAGSLLREGEILQAAEVIVSAVLKEETLSYRMPIAEVIGQIDKSYRKLHAARLSTPIIFNLVRSRSSKVESYRTYAYEDFLTSHGLSRPSELKALVASFDPAELIYYLRWICTPDTMQMSTAFAGTREYEDERVAVCALLSELDPENVKEYEAESRAITQNQVIRGGVTQVEENKIYVDVPALGKWADVNLLESYTRYQALRNSGMYAGDAQLLETVREALKGYVPESIIFGLPQNEATDLLITMLNKLIDEFLGNGQHGLDCYLSMRVRHGSLAGQLRNPLESNHIITQREGDTDQYKTNEYWLSQFPGLDVFDRAELDKALKTFSRSYDALIDAYSNDFIQIRSAEKPHGLFYLPLSDSGVVLLADNILQDTSFEEFLDHAFRYLRELLDHCLGIVRMHIESRLRPQTDALVAELEGQLAKLGIQHVQELDAAVHVAHTELQRTIEHLKQWFHRSEPEKGRDFAFEELVRIGLMCVTRLHDGFHANLSVVAPATPLLFEHLSFFSDIFFIVFDNVRVHSGTTFPQVLVEACIRGRDLHVSIRSDVLIERITSESLEKIAAIKEMIKTGGFHRAVRSEGGTGLIKLKNILRWSPSTGQSLDFRFDQDAKQFVVELAVPLVLARSTSGER